MAEFEVGRHEGRIIIAEFFDENGNSLNPGTKETDPLAKHVFGDLSSLITRCPDLKSKGSFRGTDEETIRKFTEYKPAEKSASAPAEANEAAEKPIEKDESSENTPKVPQENKTGEKIPPLPKEGINLDIPFLGSGTTLDFSTDVSPDLEMPDLRWAPVKKIEQPRKEIPKPLPSHMPPILDPVAPRAEEYAKERDPSLPPSYTLTFPDIEEIPNRSYEETVEAVREMILRTENQNSDDFIEEGVLENLFREQNPVSAELSEESDLDIDFDSLADDLLASIASDEIVYPDYDDEIGAEGFEKLFHEEVKPISTHFEEPVVEETKPATEREPQPISKEELDLTDVDLSLYNMMAGIEEPEELIPGVNTYPLDEPSISEMLDL
ncbi:MAG: hypothetical protein SNF33_08275 [Candidatus Algichlamydia australiensis]|nr:hypothetical protein [Chlamydiales bacterium]